MWPAQKHRRSKQHLLVVWGSLTVRKQPELSMLVLGITFVDLPFDGDRQGCGVYCEGSRKSQVEPGCPCPWKWPTTERHDAEAQRRSLEVVPLTVVALSRA